MGKEQKTKNLITKLAEEIVNSKYCVVLTGAGSSTESGIPDFRSKDSGIYNRVGENVFSSRTFDEEPQIFYSFAKEWLAEVVTKKPNKAHLVLAELEKKGFIKTVITQNIDGLHQKAGSKNVLEVHGHIRYGFCQKCNFKMDIDIITKKLLKDDQIPVRCDRCDGVIKPAVVFFGDMLTEDFQTAVSESRKSDLMLIMGSSLVVYPVASLPQYVQGKIVIINKDPTPYDSMAEIVIHDLLGNVFGTLEKELESKNYHSKTKK